MCSFIKLEIFIEFEFEHINAHQILDIYDSFPSTPYHYSGLVNTFKFFKLNPSEKRDIKKLAQVKCKPKLIQKVLSTSNVSKKQSAITLAIAKILDYIVKLQPNVTPILSGVTAQMKTNLKLTDGVVPDAPPCYCDLTPLI